MTSKLRFFSLACLALASFAFSVAETAAGTKLRVTHAQGAGVYKAAALGPTIATVPLNAVLDAELKQGEFWKVSVEVNGVKTTGYVHEFLVEVVTEGDQPATGPLGSVKTQSELVAEIELKIDECKKSVIQQTDLAAAVDGLRALLPKAFNLEDPQKQKQIACDIYLWTGCALARQDEDTQATKEFKNMFEVDFLTARTSTKNMADPNISRLLEIAEKKYNGSFVGYSLHIDTEPKEAILKVEGKTYRSPDVISTENARVVLEIEKEGYRSERFVIPLKDVKTVKTYVLQSIGRTVRIDSDPPGAAVFLDGKDTGQVTVGVLPYLSYGTHRIALKKDRYADWEEEFEVPEGSTDPLSITAALTVKTYSLGYVWGKPDGKSFTVPTSLAVDKAGGFYVADGSPYKVRRFRPDRGVDTSWGVDVKALRSLKSPAGIAIDNENCCYVTDARDGTVSKFDKAGKFLRKWGDEGPKEARLSQPIGIAVDAAFDIYVVDAGNGRIVKYSSAGTVKKTWGKAGAEPGQFHLPTGVAVNSRNEVVVVDSSRVQKFTADGDLVGFFGQLGSAEGEIKRAFGVCCDADDNIYVADGGNDRVQKFSSDGRFVGQIGGTGAQPGQLLVPVAVAVGAKGTVFILEKDNSRIQAFEPPAK